MDNYDERERQEKEMMESMSKLQPYIMNRLGARFAMWHGRVMNEETKQWEETSIVGRFHGFFQSNYYRKYVEDEKEQTHSYPVALLEKDDGEVIQVSAHGLQFMPQVLEKVEE